MTNKKSIIPSLIVANFQWKTPIYIGLDSLRSKFWTRRNSPNLDHTLKYIYRVRIFSDSYRYESMSYPSTSPEKVWVIFSEAKKNPWWISSTAHRSFRSWSFQIWTKHGPGTLAHLDHCFPFLGKNVQILLWLYRQLQASPFRIGCSCNN